MSISVQVRPTNRRTVVIQTPAAPAVTVNVQEGLDAQLQPKFDTPDADVARLTLQAHIDDLQDVDVSAIPTPYPPELNFAEDERYTLVYDPTTGQWIAAPEPVITAIDGGEY